MIYTLDWLEKEADKIASAWNGEDTTYMVEDEVYTEDHAGAAKDLALCLMQVRSLIKELNI